VSIITTATAEKSLRVMIDALSSRRWMVFEEQLKWAAN
jgi:hypothetical protein